MEIAAAILALCIWLGALIESEKHGRIVLFVLVLLVGLFLKIVL